MRIILLLLILCGPAVGATYNCLTLTESEVQSNVNLCISGDTVTMPSGTNSWPTVMTNSSHNITLIGYAPTVSCLNDVGDAFLRPTNYVNPVRTVIYNETGGQLINFTTVSNTYLCRLANFTICGGVTNPAPDTSKFCVEVHGYSPALRMDHLEFCLVQESCLEVDGWEYGVIDHCVFEDNGYIAVTVDHQNWGGQLYGDGSWADADYFGSTNTVVIESCTFTNNHSATSVDDAGEKGGGRHVIRYCAVTNSYLSIHGTESSQRYRGGRNFEYYGITAYWDTNHSSAQTWFTFFEARSGTGVCWSNWMFGFDRIGVLPAYRATPGNGWTPWGNVDGTNQWDATGSNIVATGTATAASVTVGLAEIMTDSNAAWTVNQFTNGYMIQDISGLSAAEITSNGVNTVTYNINTPTSGTEHFAIGDHYQIAGIVTNVLDQAGRGAGDLLTNYPPVNATRGGIVANPRQTLIPIHEWSNTYIWNSAIGDPNKPFLTGDVTIQTNRDYVDGIAMPGYAPLVYPHPLVTNSPPLSVITTKTFGNATIGNGTF